MADDEAGVLRRAALAAPDVPSQELMEAYRRARADRSEAVDVRSLTVAMGSDGAFRWPSLRLAAAQGSRGNPTYVYLFEWESPAFGGILGSCHGLELPFVFGAIDLPAVQFFTGGGVEVQSLSAQMQRAWLEFRPLGRSIARRARYLAHLGQAESVDHDLRAPDRRGRPSTDRELSVWEEHRPLASGRAGLAVGQGQGTVSGTLAEDVPPRARPRRQDHQARRPGRQEPVDHASRTDESAVVQSEDR